MAAVFLAPLYLLCNVYIVYWMIRWLRAAAPVLGAGAGLIPVLAVYCFLMLSLLTSFLVRSYPAKRYLKKIQRPVAGKLCIYSGKLPFSWIWLTEFSKEPGWQTPGCIPEAGWRSAERLPLWEWLWW